ncbi:MAG: DUF6159 family protein [Polyangiaceae bacterium]
MNVFSRSWNLTKLSFEVIKQDSEMLLFPLIGGISSIVYAVALIYPTIVVNIVRETTSGAGEVALNMVDFAILFAAYMGLAFIATFFNVCVVYTTKTRFEGGDATFMDSLKFALSRLHLIFMWSVLSATVGILLHSLDRAAERAGALGGLFLGILRSILGAAWSILTIFVVPAMVYRDLGPIQAIKSSTQTLRQTWGESLVRHYGLGLMQFLFILLGVAITVAMAVGLSALGTTGYIITGVFALVYFVAVVLVFNVANAVFNTALYAWANTGEAPASFDHATLRGAIGNA